MDATIRSDHLSELIKRKRLMESLSLRKAAAQCNVSVATLYRAEKAEGVPDTKTLASIAGWLNVPLDQFLLTGTKRDAKEAGQVPPSTPEVVEVHLRADKNLSPKTAAALAEVFRAAYEHFSRHSNSD